MFNCLIYFLLVRMRQLESILKNHSSLQMWHFVCLGGPARAMQFETFRFRLPVRVGLTRRREKGMEIILALEVRLSHMVVISISCTFRVHWSVSGGWPLSLFMIVGFGDQWFSTHDKTDSS